MQFLCFYFSLNISYATPEPKRGGKQKNYMGKTIGEYDGGE